MIAAEELEAAPEKRAALLPAAQLNARTWFLQFRSPEHLATILRGRTTTYRHRSTNRVAFIVHNDPLADQARSLVI